MARIQDLPLEIIQQILLWADPADVAKFSQTCTAFAAFVYNSDVNISFWRDLYLRQPYDDPRLCYTELGQSVGDDIDWKGRLTRIVRACIILKNPALCHEGERPQFYQTFLDMVRELPPTNEDNLEPYNAAYLASLLMHEDLFWSQPLHWGERQIRAHLHTYFGLIRRDLEGSRRTEALRTEALGQVYSLRNWKAENFWGPFWKDSTGRVDWELMLNIHLVISMHIVPPNPSEYVEDGFLIYPLSLPFCQSCIPRGFDLDHEEDWAGVTGLWDCAFCFIDHRALLVYNNFNLAEDIPLNTSLFEDSEFEEVFRIIRIQFRVTGSEPDPAHPTRPKLFIEGGMHGHIHMFGFVAITPDDNVRWHFVSGEPGHAVWSSEGVQVAGVRSMFGILGMWSSADHDASDPVGPFWLHKVSSSDAEDLGLE